MGYVINILDDHHIPYIIIKKRVKRLTIKYNLQMVLEIHQPVNFADVNVIKFVEDHIDWILNHKPNKPIPHESYHDGDSYLMLGKEYTIEIVYSNHETVVLNNNKIMVYTSSDNKIEKLLEKFRYEYAEVVFNEILAYRVIKRIFERAFLDFTIDGHVGINRCKKLRKIRTFLAVFHLFLGFTRKIVDISVNSVEIAILFNHGKRAFLSNSRYARNIITTIAR
jgi:hypothetical protein